MFAACFLATLANLAESLGQSAKPNALWLEQLTLPIRNGQARIESAASCASTACHGGPRAGVGDTQAVRGSEYPLWLESDPHAQSWRTLCSDVSVKMLERLKIVREGQVVDQAAFDNCLACHNTTTNQNHDFHAEGVGCASCHGPSENWRGDHYRVQRDDLSSSQCGMVPNKNLLARARTCAACHVGDRDRDMNHDIIAAGHPALHYEFATYHNMLPKHWREPVTEDFEAQLWLAGQIASLDASLALLEARAAKRLNTSAWPEFAASDCSVCHQNLRIAAADYAAPVKATATLSSWNRFGLEQLLKLQRIETGENGAGETLALDVSKLSELMRAGGIDNRMEVGQGARSARFALDMWLKSSNGHVHAFTASRLQHLAAASMRDQSEFGHWEFIAQSYLAAIASRQAWSKNEFAVAEAQRLRRGLLFKPSTSLLSLADEPNRNVTDTLRSFAHLLESDQHPMLPPIREPRELQLELVPAPLPR
jgi:Cytochrome c554 and c-prime